MKISRRSVQTAEQAVTGRTIAGIGIVYNAESREITDWNGTYRERIAPGAFAETLRSGEDVKLLYNHDPKWPLARTRSGTLTLQSERSGLRFTADLPETSVGNDIRALMERGDLTGEMSFGFIVEEDSWNKDRSERLVKRARLLELSIVVDAAYPQTSSALRGAQDHAQRERALRLRAMKGF
jgi:HK97 family phage prohead protease